MVCFVNSVSGILTLSFVVLTQSAMAVDVAPSTTVPEASVNSLFSSGNLQPTPSALPTVKPTTFDYPASFPILHGLIRQSTPFTIKEKTNAVDSITADGDCLSFTVSHQSCRKSATSGAGTAGFNSMIMSALIGSAVGELFDSYLWGIGASFLFMLGSLVIGSDAATTGETSTGVSEDEAQTRNTTFSNKACNTSGVICNDETFVFESDISWGSYGWITPEGEQSTGNSQPACLTKDPQTNAITFKDCAYRTEDGQRKVIDAQLWKFKIYAYLPQEGGTIVTGPVVNMMVNKAEEEDECINITGANNPTCKKYWLGTVFEDNGCRLPPSEEPGVCSTK